VYLALPAFLLLLRAGPWLPLGLAAAAAAALWWLAPAAAGPWYAWTTLGVLRAVPSFAFGVALFGARAALGGSGAGRLFWAALAGFVAAIFAGLPPPWLLLAAWAVVALGVAADAGGRRGVVVRRLAPLGQLTYGVYMLHGAVLMLSCNILLDRVLHLTGAARNAWVVASMVAVLPVSWASYALFERPARRALSRWRPGRARPAGHFSWHHLRFP